MTTPLILLPGDPVPQDHLPSTTSHAPLRLGPGLRLLSHPSTSTSTSTSKPPSHTITASQAGLLTSDPKRNTLSLLTPPQRRYTPSTHDLVIAQIHHSSADFFHCVLTAQTPQVVLAQLGFEGATKKTRPMLKQGDVVYARVLNAGSGAGAEVELTCVNPATGKAEGGLGPLSGGMVFDVSVGLAGRLIRASSGNAGGEEKEEGVEGLVVLDELGRKLEKVGGFEIAVGRNGKVWVDCANAGDAAVRATVAIGRCLGVLDERLLLPGEQRKLVARVLREMKVE